MSGGKRFNGRLGLRDREGQRLRFQGTFERLGRRRNWHGFDEPTILLRNVRAIDDGAEVTDPATELAPQVQDRLTFMPVGLGFLIVSDYLTEPKVFNCHSMRGTAETYYGVAKYMYDSDVWKSLGGKSGAAQLLRQRLPTRSMQGPGGRPGKPCGRHRRRHGNRGGGLPCARDRTT